MEIRIFSIRFAKRKAKEKRDMEFELLRKLQDLNARIDAAPEGSPLANEAKKIKIKLGIPIDRVPTSKSCVFCLGIKFPFFPHLTVSWSLPVTRIIFLKSSQIQWLYKPAI